MHRNPDSVVSARPSIIRPPPPTKRAELSEDDEEEPAMA
jgi:hypothetical protein